MAHSLGDGQSRAEGVVYACQPHTQNPQPHPEKGKQVKLNPGFGPSPKVAAQIEHKLEGPLLKGLSLV